MDIMHKNYDLDNNVLLTRFSISHFESIELNLFDLCNY